MSKAIEVVAEVESAVNQLANVAAADVGGFTRGEEGEVEITLTVRTGEAPAAAEKAAANDEPANDAGGDDGETLETKGFSMSTDDFDPSEALARMREAREGGAANDGGSETADSDICGAETADGSPCRFTPGGKCPHHNSASGSAKADDGGSDDDGPTSAAGYVRENGPCVAARGKDGAKPCGYGAKDPDTPFCGRHAGMKAPALNERALEAREDWESGRLTAINDFITKWVQADG